MFQSPNATGVPLRILIPAHNEAGRIERTLRTYCAEFENDAKITVIMNGCTDDTASVVERLACEYQNLEGVNIAAPIGKGGALRAGFMLAREPFVGYVDADGSTDAVEFRRLYCACWEQHADGIIASRWTKGAIVHPKQPVSRRFASRTFNAICRVLFGLTYHDTQCGAKVFRRDAVVSVLDNLELANFAFDVDLLFQLKSAGFCVFEEPTVWADAAGTKVRLARTSGSMFLALLRLRLRRSWFGRLPFIDYIARQSVIVVGTQPSVLALYAGDGAYDELLNVLCARLQDLGAVVRCYGPPPQTSKLGLFVSRVRFWGWYMFFTSRPFDAIIESVSKVPYHLASVSAKRSYLVGTRSPSYRRYARSQSVSMLNLQAEAERIFLDASLSHLYSAHFVRSPGGGYSLVYPDAISGERREHTLH